VNYQPKPIDTTAIELSPEILKLTEHLAENAHDIWAAQRLSDDWTYGPERNDQQKKHPCLIPYADLPDSEKQYDRNAALETLKAIIALGYRIEQAGKATQVP
jgi:ryanodine receptor 2